MNREEMLEVIAQNKKIMEECRQAHPDPKETIIYIEDEKGEKKGHIEYDPGTDRLRIISGGTTLCTGGDVIKPLIKALKKLDE